MPKSRETDLSYYYSALDDVREFIPAPKSASSEEAGGETDQTDTGKSEKAIAAIPAKTADTKVNNVLENEGDTVTGAKEDPDHSSAQGTNTDTIETGNSYAAVRRAASQRSRNFIKQNTRTANSGTTWSENMPAGEEPASVGSDVVAAEIPAVPPVPDSGGTAGLVLPAPPKRAEPEPGFQQVPAYEPDASAVSTEALRRTINDSLDRTNATPDQLAGRPDKDRAVEIITETLLSPGQLSQWRNDFQEAIAAQGDVIDETEKAHQAADFAQLVANRYEKAGYDLTTFKNQLSYILMVDDDIFEAYVQGYDRSASIDPDSLTEQARQQAGYSLSLRAATNLQTRWQNNKDRLSKIFISGEKARRNRIILGLGAAATIAAAAYGAYRWGYSAGYDAGVDSAGGLPGPGEAGIDSLGDAPATPDTPESPPKGLPLEVDPAETGPVDVSAEMGLPEGYIERSPEGYEITAMPGGETDSIWRAAEHALEDHLKRKPTIVEINNLQNIIGDHWLDVGDKVNITQDMIQRSLGL